MKPLCRALRKSSPVGARAAARNQDDCRRIDRVDEPHGDLEAIDIRKLDIQKDKLWPQARRRSQRRLPVSGLPKHLETVCFQQRASEPAKLSVIIDDQDRPPHRRIVARTRSSRIGATPPLIKRRVQSGDTRESSPDPGSREQGPWLQFFTHRFRASLRSADAQ
jgi:hypothetical protein